MSTNISYTANTSFVGANTELIEGRKADYSFTPYQTSQSADVYAMARAFLSISAMTNKKLQKLCYYAKAWYLALYDENIISEDFQAWVHGAVQPSLYKKYKQYGFSEIPLITDTTTIPRDFLDFSREIYRSYGDLSGDELEILNHKEEPWIKARGDKKPWESCTTVISEEDMKEYYRKLMNNA